MVPGSPHHPAILGEHTILVRDGKIVRDEGPREPGAWVYAWLRPGRDEPPFDVGATGLPLAERVQLHLESAEPLVGRVRAEHPEALHGEVEVRGFLLTPGTDRKAVGRALGAHLAGKAASGDPMHAAIAAALAARLGR